MTTTIQDPLTPGDPIEVGTLLVVLEKGIITVIKITITTTIIIITIGNLLGSRGIVTQKNKGIVIIINLLSINFCYSSSSSSYYYYYY